jgi:hypothetical protein
LNSQATLGKFDSSVSARRRLAVVRLLLPLGWVLASIGFFGPWIAHQTAALTLSGVDMGEFVKFLPGVVDGSLQVMRQWFYLPPFAVAVSVALLSSSRRLGYPWTLRTVMLLLAIPVSLQLLPPAWAPSSLLSGEFRLQALALGLCWLLFAGSWLLGRLPSWLVGTLSAVLSLGAMVLPASQLVAAKPAIDQVYHVPPTVGWGFPVCLAGLAVMTAGSIMVMLRIRTRRTALWASE